MHSSIWPTSPGAILGYRKNGTPIRLIAGGSGEGDEGGTSTEGQGDAGSGDTGQQDNDNGGSGSRDDTGTRDDKGRFSGGGNEDAAKTERTVAAIRDDFKQERAKRQATEKALADFRAETEAREKARTDAETERNRKLAIALGVAPEEEPPDPAKLLEELNRKDSTHKSELSSRDAEIRQSKVELAVLRSAGKHGGNGDALLDSRSFMAKVNGLDPSADGFADELAEAIKAAVENGPQYKAAAPKADEGGSGSGQNGNGTRKPPARSGGEHTTPGGNRQWTREEAAAVAKKDPQVLMAAINDGLLVDIGYPPQSKR